MPYRSVACLDVRDDCGRVGPTNALEVHGAGGQQVVDAALEVPRGDMGIEVRARASGVRADVPVARQRVGRDAKFLGGPGEREGGSVELGLRHRLLVEVSFADDEEVAGRVVARRGVAHEVGRPQLEDVPVAVDADVIGDVDPPLLVLVVPLVLAEASR